MILVKCTVLDSEPRLKQALQENKIIHSGASIGLEKEVIGFKKNIVHTSAILADYHTHESVGLIFDSKQDPKKFVPFDLDFFRILNKLINSYPAIKPKIVNTFRKKFVFKDVNKMAKAFPSPIAALAELDACLHEYAKDLLEANSDDYGKLKPLTNIMTHIDHWKTRPFFRHNEAVFENQVEIEPLAFFGKDSVVKARLKKYKVQSDLKIYSTAEAYFKEHEVTYK